MPGNLEDNEGNRNCDQRRSNHLFSTFAEVLVQTSPKPEAKLGGCERLDTDENNRDEQRHLQQSKADAEGEFIDADADAEVNCGQTPGMSKQCEPLVLPFVLTRPEQQYARQANHRGGRIARKGPEESSNATAYKNAHDRHACFEGHER